MLRYAFDELHLHRIEAAIVPRNAPSRRVADKLGLRDEGVARRLLQIRGVYEDHVRYAITAEEWAERRDELAADVPDLSRAIAASRGPAGRVSGARGSRSSSTAG